MRTLDGLSTKSMSQQFNDVKNLVLQRHLLGSVENAECGVRSAECGKCGVWKMGSVENAGCGKCGVWKMRRKFQFSVSLCHSNVDKQCVNDKKK